MRVKQNYYGAKWIGGQLPTLWGRLRYWYYKKRGWIINDEYFYVGKRPDKVIEDVLLDFKGRGGKLK